MKLTGREKSSLILEGVVTVILLLLLNMAIIVIIQDAIQSNPGVTNGIFMIKQSLKIGPLQAQIWSYQRILIAFLVIIDVWVVWWRLRRRYHLYQMDHIIAELHYIAQGHLDHRIPFRLKGNQQHVITSVNALVDSAVRSMDDERKSEKSKDELITNVSHDLRTPLTSMDDLFEYTKVQQHGAPVNIMKIDLNQLIEQLTASFELEAQHRGIEITSSVIPNPLMIEADPEKLGRVFNNLVSNAFKYGNGASYIRIDARQENDMVVVKVANDGTPIPEKALDHLFERFYRAEASRSRATGGTGLGLAIVKSIVDLHHGSVKVTSNEDETAFIVTLPLKQEVKETNQK